MGAVDCAMALVKDSRFERKATLNITSRDEAERQLVVCFDDCKWNLLSNDAVEYEKVTTFESNGVVNAIIEFIAKNKSWLGTATELLELLKEYSNDLPLQANKLTKEINQYKQQLLERNIVVENKVVTGKRLINLSLVSAPSLETAKTKENSAPP